MRRPIIGAILGALTCGSALAEAPAAPHTIAVAGQAELLIPPDYAMIELGVISQAPLVSDAQADNSARMTRVIDAMKGLGVLEKNIRTSTFVIQPKYEKMAPWRI